MQFVWDPEKARKNLSKHGVGFTLAERIWDDPLHVITWDQYVDGEDRWIATGLAGSSATLVVVHCHPDPDETMRVRIISARRATTRERRRYEQQCL